MSLLKSNSVQIGQSATATQNFTLSVPSSPDGTIKLARGNSGATTADILSIASNGKVSTTLADSSVAFAQLLSTDWTSLHAAGNGTAGYQKLPSGLIIQWGSASASTGGVSVTFAIAFPTYAYTVVATNNNQTNPPAPSIGSLSTTGFVATVSSGTPNFYYIAIGK